MAGRLKDDQIRWILSLEAKGVQGKLVQVSSAINNLKQENKGLQQEMKAVERIMAEAERAMEKMEKSGQTNTKQYQYAKESYQSNSQALVELKSNIDKNNQSIANLKAEFGELNKTLGVNDMTMNQLKQRAADLQKQLNNTSLSTDPKAYKALQKELSQVNGRMFDVEIAGKSMLNQFASMHNPIGQAAKAVQGFGQALKVLIANPVGIVIATIAAVFMTLKEAISHNGEAMNKLNQILAPFKEGFEILMTLLGKLANLIMDVLLKAFNGLLDGLTATLKFLGLNTDALEAFNQKTRESIEIEKERQKLARETQADILKNADDEAKIAELRNKSRQKDNYTAQERLNLINEADKLEKEIANRNVKRTTDDLNHKIKKYRLEGKIAKDLSADKIRMMLEEGKILGTLTEDQTKELVGLYAAVTNASSDYFKTTERLQMQMVSALNEINNDAKQARENQLKEIDKTLDLEINKLKQTRMKGLITEKEYNDKVEEMTVESLKKKLAIKGQEQHQLIQYESRILDAQIKRQEQADKELLKQLTDAKDNQLKLLESRKNTRLEKLQEEETDQKIYALRAAEIEAQTAKDREDVIRAFGLSIEQAEFQNNQIRLDALKAGGEEIVSAESATLKEREKLNKLFAKTTADFERQYNIKTWEQRKADELRILKKQYDEKLLSEETYQLALQAIENKYEDEKLKIRQQYGIASLKELYNSEMDLLIEQHEKGLLSEEEFEKAKLQIKLKYAQEYAQLSEEFIQSGSNAVKAIEEAQTAQTEAEYTKRQSALTEQYNQGIISQEEYNEQKEQLDYEQKSKELEIQKKYADVNFAMQVAQILATTAQGIITAWSTSMTLGPIAGPIAAAAMSVLLGVTSAAQIAKAKAERDRVKAMTLESPGGSGSAPRTGQIRLKEGFAEGGLNYDSGGYTGAGGKYEVAGYVPVHHGEYVIANEELRLPEVMNMARAIESVRKKRTVKNTVPGFADGGSNTPYGMDGASIPLTGHLISRMLSVLQRLETDGITVQTNYGVTELEAEQRRKQEAESKFTKK